MLRGHRHRWVEIGRNRSAEVLAAAARREAAGPFEWLTTAEQLTDALYHQVAPGVERMDAVGRGEALALAVLSNASGPAATAFDSLAAGCSARLSPLPFAATTDASIVEAAGLPAIPVDHVAVVKLFVEPSGAPTAEQAVPRLSVMPLLPPSDAEDAAEGAADDMYVGMGSREDDLCQWALGHRLPLLIDFDADPYWGKRAGALAFVKLHALLFLSPPHAELAGVVRAAAARFPRGSVIVMQFMTRDFNPGENAMFERYGVKSVLDTPRLVFLDQRVQAGEGKTVNRQRVFPSTITEQAVVDFISQLEAEGAPPLVEERPVKDEL